MYTCEGLSHDEATQLFSVFAFGQNHPATGNEELSNHVVEYANGNPFVLKVMAGNFSYGERIFEWKSSLEIIKDSLQRDFLNIYRISFDSLDEESKNIFLHIACFFNGKKVDRVLQVLDFCGFYSRIGMKVLIDKSLVTISNNILRMNRLVEEMGRTIVRRECELHCGKCSRLWDHRDVNAVIRKNSVRVNYIDLIKLHIQHFGERNCYL